MKYWHRIFILLFFTPSLIFAAEPKADKIRLDTTNFDTNLSATDTNVASKAALGLNFCH